MRCWFVLFISVLGFSACSLATDPNSTPASSDAAGSSGPSSLLSMFQSKPLYYGLKKDSYGPLTIYQDADTHKPITPPSCNPNAKYSDVNELARQITAAIASPLQSSFKADDPIAQEELQHNFKIVSDPGGTPPVGILDRSSDGIVFWHESDLVTLPEVYNAASEFCSRKKKAAVYEGSARKCSEPKLMPVVVNGQRTTIDTYAISSFACQKK